jgi:hypothetical protein
MFLFNSLYQKNIYLLLLYFFRSIYWRIKFKSKCPIIARHGCSGADVLKIMKSKFDIINIQNVRID